MAQSPALYDGYAEWYSRLRGTKLLPTEVLLADLVEPLAGKRVLDLGCGAGVLTRELARRGADVVGVDNSDAQLALARSHQGPGSRVRYLRDDACRPQMLADGSFDAVVSHLTLMDLDGLEEAYRSVCRVLVSGGVAAFSIVHPCFHLPVVGGRIWDSEEVIEHPNYFRECRWRSTPEGGVRARVGANHRTLSTYINQAVAAGLTIVRLAEGRLSEGGPVILTLVCRAGGGGD